MKIKVGISNRHVHLCLSDYQALFGSDELKIDRILSQPGEFASDKYVTLKTSKNKIERVRVLGPLREYTQVEISKTDAYKLGLNPPVRNSGDLANSETITLAANNNEITKDNVCIIANRHIHLSSTDQSLDENKKYKVYISSQKPGIIYDVYVKKGNYLQELHLDTDDANAFLLKNGDEVTILDE